MHIKRIAAFLLVLAVTCVSALMGCSGGSVVDGDAQSTPGSGGPASKATDDSGSISPIPSPTDENEGESTMNEKVYAVIEMENGGKIKLELYPDIAPQSVYNFVSLARSGFYDGLTFHRIIAGFVIQGGDPEGTGTGGPGYRIKGEFSANGFENNLKHTRGVISWARSSNSYDSAGSQFFIMHEDAPHLDGQYAAFGMVIDGLDVVDEIASSATDSNGRPYTPVVIKSITIEGPDLPEPNKLG